MVKVVGFFSTIWASSFSGIMSSYASTITLSSMSARG